MKRLLLSKSKAVTELKEETTRQITSKYKAWKQHNALAQAHLLLSKKVDYLYSELNATNPLSAVEQNRLDKAEAILADVRRMAKRSNQLEDDIKNGLTPDITTGWE